MTACYFIPSGTYGSKKQYYRVLRPISRKLGSFDELESLRKLAQVVADQMPQRANENIEQWAERLAKDLSEFND